MEHFAHSNCGQGGSGIGHEATHLRVCGGTDGPQPLEVLGIHGPCADGSAGRDERLDLDDQRVVALARLCRGRGEDRASMSMSSEQEALDMSAAVMRLTGARPGSSRRGEILSSVATYIQHIIGQICERPL